MKAVLDTNVIVSGIIKKEGPPGQILHLLTQSGKFSMVTSLEILVEIREVLGREKIRKYHKWSNEQIDKFIIFLNIQSVITEGKLKVQVISKDPKDNMFLACAQEGNADYLVTGDDHLLELSEYNRTKIITPATFFGFLKSDPRYKKKE